MNTYSGTLRCRLQTVHLGVGEYSYPGRYRIARHVHDLPFISLLLNGRYRERVEPPLTLAPEPLEAVCELRARLTPVRELRDEERERLRVPGNS
jgi:hypothetical protein